MDGSVLNRIPSPGNRFIQQPAWMSGDSSIVMVNSGETGKSLVSYNPETGCWKSLFHAGGDDISSPVVAGDWIFFSGTFSGIDNIFGFDITRGETFQVSSSRFGAFQPRVSNDGQHLYYSNYTAKGYKIAELSLKEGMWKPIADAGDHTEQLDYDLTNEGVVEATWASIQDSTSYQVKKYAKHAAPREEQVEKASPGYKRWDRGS